MENLVKGAQYQCLPSVCPGNSSNTVAPETLNLGELELQTPPPAGMNPVHVYALQGKTLLLTMVRGPWLGGHSRVQCQQI